jgi:hypothetical protein
MFFKKKNVGTVSFEQEQWNQVSFFNFILLIYSIYMIYFIYIILICNFKHLFQISIWTIFWWIGYFLVNW